MELLLGALLLLLVGSWLAGYLNTGDRRGEMTKAEKAGGVMTTLTDEQIDDIWEEAILALRMESHAKADAAFSQAKRAHALEAECERLRKESTAQHAIAMCELGKTREAERRLAVANKWIRQHRTELDKDYACKECAPYSDMLIDGFQCAYHLALREVK
jgi:hypothetical protein